MTVELNAAIAAKVRGAVAEKQLNQVDVAEILHLSKMAVSRRFSAQVAFEAVELLQLSRALGVPVERFFPTPADT